MTAATPPDEQPVAVAEVGSASSSWPARRDGTILRDGDRLLVRWGAAPVVGRVAVVRLPGDRPLAVKRLLRLEPEGWWVERDSPTEGVDSWSVERRLRRTCWGSSSDGRGRRRRR